MKRSFLTLALWLVLVNVASASTTKELLLAFRKARGITTGQAGQLLVPPVSGTTWWSWELGFSPNAAQLAELVRIGALSPPPPPPPPIISSPNEGFVDEERWSYSALNGEQICWQAELTKPWLCAQGIKK